MQSKWSDQNSRILSGPDRRTDIHFEYLDSTEVENSGIEYYFWTLKFNLQTLKKFDTNMRNIMNELCAKHTNIMNSVMYLPRGRRGRCLWSLEVAYKEIKIKVQASGPLNAGSCHKMAINGFRHPLCVLICSKQCNLVFLAHVLVFSKKIWSYGGLHILKKKLNRPLNVGLWNQIISKYGWTGKLAIYEI